MNHSCTTALEYLMKNSDFLQWARGEKPEDDARWEEWVKGEPQRRAVLENAIALVNSVEANSLEVSDIYVEHRIRQALYIAKKIEEERKRSRVSRLFSRFSYRWAVAASLIVALGIGLSIYGTGWDSSPEQVSTLAKTEEGTATGLTQIINRNREVKYVQLPDGSSVVLQRYSSIRFPGQFDPAKREVYLSGEAFFEVTKNPVQPFYVYAHELVARVHGTSFSIKAGRQDGQVEVAVKTGQVCVYSKGEAGAVEASGGKAASRLMLTSNQQATLDRRNLTLVRSAQRNSVLLNLPIEQHRFTYSEAPVSEVFATLGITYGVEIDYNKDQMANCSITATLGDEPLENKIRWICAILEAHYEITGGKIRIRGNSCLAYTNLNPNPI